MNQNQHGKTGLNGQNGFSNNGGEGQKISSDQLDELLAAAGIAFDDEDTKEAARNDRNLKWEILNARLKELCVKKSEPQKGKAKRPVKPRASRKSVSYKKISSMDVTIIDSTGGPTYNPHEAAAMLGVTVWAVRKQIQRGSLVAEIVDNAYQISHNELTRKLRQAFRNKKR